MTALVAPTGYVYREVGSPIAVSVRPRLVASHVHTYLAAHGQQATHPPVKMLVQYERHSGRYEVTFEDADRTRWQVTPANIDTIREELRPRLEPGGMTVELRWGYPNRVGTGAVVVMAATATTVRLGVHDGRGEVPAETYTNWETFEVDGVRWTIEAIYGMPSTDGAGPPGTGAGHVVAVVNHESAGV